MTLGIQSWTGERANKLSSQRTLSESQCHLAFQSVGSLRTSGAWSKLRELNNKFLPLQWVLPVIDTPRRIFRIQFHFHFHFHSHSHSHSHPHSPLPSTDRYHSVLWISINSKYIPQSSILATSTECRHTSTLGPYVSFITVDFHKLADRPTH